ncbi:DUF1836 domain-containing protein [Bavariicoccus seileri]|uniref:DUF1836 domain-containing protein n=1 Tax=Bavariicoccus seileri TaxID=549685 RepID=UPI003F90D48B
MADRIIILLERSLPTWNDLPAMPLFNQQVVDYVNEQLGPYLLKNQKLTSTMIQNYTKWEVLPKPIGRKYDRLHIAQIIVITILKHIIPLEDVHSGINLMVQLVGHEEAYDSFIKTLSESTKRTFEPLLDPTLPSYRYSGFEISRKLVAIAAISDAYSRMLLTEMILEKQGIRGLLKETH